MPANHTNVYVESTVQMQIRTHQKIRNYSKKKDSTLSMYQRRLVPRTSITNSHYSTAPPPLFPRLARLSSNHAGLVSSMIESDARGECSVRLQRSFDTCVAASVEKSIRLRGGEKGAMKRPIPAPRHSLRQVGAS